MWTILAYTAHKSREIIYMSIYQLDILFLIEMWACEKYSLRLQANRIKKFHHCHAKLTHYPSPLLLGIYNYLSVHHTILVWAHAYWWHRCMQLYFLRTSRDSNLPFTRKRNNKNDQMKVAWLLIKSIYLCAWKELGFDRGIII